MAENNFPRIITQKQKIDFIKQKFKKKLGYDLNIQNPETFNEKIQWMKIFYQRKIITECADKYEVRRFVKKTIGDEYLIPLVGKGVYSSVSELSFDALPEKFVLKTTDGWKTNIICTDKSKLDIDETRRKLEGWLDKGHSHYYLHLEWAYKNIRPRIICEEFIEQAGGLIDYRFWCFNGSVGLIQVSSDRQIGQLKQDYFDCDWNHLDITRSNYPNNDRGLSKPRLLEQMIDISEKLATPFPFVRVDLYEVNGVIKVGELTFYPANGMADIKPFEWDKKLGSMLKLPGKGFVFPFEINKRKLGHK